MHERCSNPMWPCAMTGAVSCLSGFSNLGVVIHGSSGCYFYAESAIPDPVHCTFIIEDEVIFGCEERLREVVGEISVLYDRIAIVTTCVPSVMGEDIRQILSDYDVMVVDTPGFVGDLEAGYKKALEVLSPRISPDRPGVNIGGICSVDPFSAGNCMEAGRLLGMAGISTAAKFCSDTLESAYHASPVTVETNPDYRCGVGTDAGSLLGLDNIHDTFVSLASRFDDADISPVLDEIEAADEQITKVCDRHLRRFDPPSVAIFGTAAYAGMIADLLKRYLDADIAFIGTRNADPLPSRFPSERIVGMDRAGEIIENTDPDIIFGSSFEHVLAPKTPYIGLTFPQRAHIMLHHRPVAGTEGPLWIIEDVLNHLMHS